MVAEACTAYLVAYDALAAVMSFVGRLCFPMTSWPDTVVVLDTLYDTRLMAVDHTETIVVAIMVLVHILWAVDSVSAIIFLCREFIFNVIHVHFVQYKLYIFAIGFFPLHDWE